MIKDSKVNKTLNNIIRGTIENDNISLFTKEISDILFNLNMDDESKLLLITMLSYGDIDGIKNISKKLLRRTKGNINAYYELREDVFNKWTNKLISEEGIRMNKYDRMHVKRVKKAYKKNIYSNKDKLDIIKISIEYEVKNILFLIRGF